MNRFQIAKGELGERPPRRPARDPSIRATIAKLKKLGHSRVSLECALGLEIGFIKQLLRKEREKKLIPAGTRALFRLLHKFPELLEVAAYNYEPKKAQIIGASILLKRLPRKSLPALRDQMLGGLKRELYQTLQQGVSNEVP